MKTNALSNIFKLANSTTPKVGKKLAGIGFSVAGVGASIQFFQPELIEFLPESSRTFYIVSTKVLDALPNILYGVGAIVAAIGGTSTVGNPDEIVEEND